MTDVFRAPVKRLDVVIDKGITWPFFYLLRDNGALRDLTGYLCRHKFLDGPGGLVLLDAAPYIVLGGVAGSVSVKLPDEITAALAWKKAFYSHELESPAGEIVLRLFGWAVVAETDA